MEQFFKINALGLKKRLLRKQLICETFLLTLFGCFGNLDFSQEYIVEVHDV
jgi:hypothetical protein